MNSMLPTWSPTIGSPVITQAMIVVVNVAIILQVKVFIMWRFSAETEIVLIFVLGVLIDLFKS